MNYFMNADSDNDNNISTGTEAKQATNQFQHKVNWFSTYIQKRI